MQWLATASRVGPELHRGATITCFFLESESTTLKQQSDLEAEEMHAVATASRLRPKALLLLAATGTALAAAVCPDLPCVGILCFLQNLIHQPPLSNSLS